MPTEVKLLNTFTINSSNLLWEHTTYHLLHSNTTNEHGFVKNFD